MSLPALPPPILAAIVAHGQLDLADIAALRLVSRAHHAAFTSREVAVFLLRHFFPFAPHDAGREAEAFSSLCRRLYRLRYEKWTLDWEVTLPGSADADADADPASAFPPDGFRLFDADSDEGYFLTAFADPDNPESTLICVRNLLAAQDVTVSVPRQDLTSISMAAGKALLTYTTPAASSILVLTDCRTATHRTLWSASLTTPIFPGHRHPGPPPLPHGHRALQPVFNAHYAAFLNHLTPSSTLHVLRFASSALHPCSLRISPSSILSFAPDAAGAHLLVCERFHHHHNLHRVVLICAHTGASLCAFHPAVAPQFHAFPARDLHAHVSPAGEEVVVWTSVRSAEYRAGLLGQLMVFSIVDGKAAAAAAAAKVRYFGGAGGGGGTGESWFCGALGVVVVAGGAQVVGFGGGLNLDLEHAGSGEWVNVWNFRPVLWRAAGRWVGAKWVVREARKGEDVVVGVMRIADVEGGEGWGMSRGSSVSEGRGSLGGEQVQVDARELAMRLAKMEKEREGGKKKGWRDKFLSVWR